MSTIPFSTVPERSISPYIRWRKNLLILAIVILFMAVLAFSAYNIWYNNTYSATISLVYAPASAAVTIDGKTTVSNKIQVKPGPHTVIIKKDGFAPNTSNITASKGQTTTVAVALRPSSAATANWYTNNPADQKINEAVGATNSAAASNQLQTSFPVASVLPLTGPTYEIDYGASPDKSGQFAMFITYYSNTGKQDALNALTSLGYNPSNYEIIYKSGL